MNSSIPNRCIYCANPSLYKLSATQYRCVTCKRKFSYQKALKEEAILDAFIMNLSALECSKKLDYNYQTISKMYHKLRLLLMQYIENTYLRHEQSFTHYDEYYFLPLTKKNRREFLFESIGILGMSYQDSVYTLLLPNQFAHLKHLDQTDIEASSYQDAYAQFLQKHKVAHYETFHSRVEQFWDYLEKFMLHFKGVHEQNFIYYLKEAEFKYNHSSFEQKTILLKLLREY